MDDDEENNHSKIRESLIAANTVTKDNEEREHIVIALHIYRDYTFMLDIAINDEIIETRDLGNNEKEAYRVFHTKQLLYFKKILVI